MNFILKKQHQRVSNLEFFLAKFLNFKFHQYLGIFPIKNYQSIANNVDQVSENSTRTQTFLTNSPNVSITYHVNLPHIKTQHTSNSLIF